MEKVMEIYKVMEYFIFLDVLKNCEYYLLIIQKKKCFNLYHVSM